MNTTEQKVRYVLRTKNRQGEFLKPIYNNKTPSNTGWNHYIHSNRQKVQEYAQQNGIIGEICKVLI